MEKNPRRFPRLPLVIIHFHKFSPDKPTILGYPHLWKSPCVGWFLQQNPMILRPISCVWIAPRIHQGAEAFEEFGDALCFFRQQKSMTKRMHILSVDYINQGKTSAIFRRFLCHFTPHGSLAFWAPEKWQVH